MRLRLLVLAFALTQLVFFGLTRFYEYLLWSSAGVGGWLTYHLSLARCGPEGVHLCLIEIGAEVRGTTLLASTLTCAALCLIACALPSLWHTVRHLTIPNARPGG